MIYISGPISNGHLVDSRTMYTNVRKGEEIMYELMNKGWSVICPHLSYHAWINWPKDLHWKRWIQQDLDFVEAVDAIFYMIPEKYGDSKGAKREFEYARYLNKTIFYDLDEVPDVEPGPSSMKERKRPL